MVCPNNTVEWHVAESFLFVDETWYTDSSTVFFLTCFCLFVLLLNHIVVMYGSATKLGIRTVNKQLICGLIPPTHGLMKGHTVYKHIFHPGGPARNKSMSYRRYVPLVQGLVKRRASSKHIGHVDDRRGVPT